VRYPTQRANIKSLFFLGKFQIEIAMKGIAAAQTLDDQEMDKFIKQYQDIKLV
tara:strand:+ start:323 stop:481 length:159 start_codon:yes stop_codon:yes gene_type:complete